MEKQPSFLSCDNDGHWYIVPVAHRDEFDAWVALDTEDERAWTPPSYVVEIGGSPGLVEFQNWAIRN